MTDNEAMQESGFEWIGAIPQEWRLDRLKDIVSLRDEKSTEKSEVEDYLELEDLEQGTGRLLSVRNTTNVESAVMKFYKGDVLFCKLRPYLRKYHLATFDGKCTGEILAFKPERIDPKFLVYFIASDGFIKVCTAMSYGAKMPRVNYPKQLALLPVCLPSIEEQKAIAAYLEQRCGKLDAIIAIKQQQIKTLDALRQSIIYHSVTKGLDDSLPLIDSGVEWLGKIPQGWRVKRLKYLTVSIKDGTHGSYERTIDGVPLLSAKNIKNGEVFVSKEESTISEDDYKAINANGNLMHGDLLLTIVGSIGRVAIYNSELKAAFQRSVAMLRVSYELETKYLFHLIQSDFFQNQLNSNTKKNIQGGIYLNDLSKIHVIYPPITEQQRIIDHLDQETQRLNDLKANLSQQIGTLEDYKKALIYECVTGKKRIKANDRKIG